MNFKKLLSKTQSSKKAPHRKSLGNSSFSITEQAKEWNISTTVHTHTYTHTQYGYVKITV